VESSLKAELNFFEMQQNTQADSNRQYFGDGKNGHNKKKPN
jgi:hypothetical protein